MRPVAALLDSLDMKTRARFRWSMDQLRLCNVLARPPLVKHVDGALWELREESQTNIYRMLYVFYTGRRTVILLGFHKKSQKTPRKEFGIAARRYRDFLAQEEQGRR